MQFVFVLDQNKKPLDPCHPARARKLLGSGRAAVYRRYPFTIVITEYPRGKDKKQEETTTQELRLKLDPGSKTTGVALVRENDKKVVWAAEIQHRGQQIRDALLSRRAIRRSRRNRPGRTRPARFDNRRRQKGWLPPSLASRLANIETWVRKIARVAPVSALSLELVKFDTQQMQNAEISGVAYQQGELLGYEVREYLLEKWGRKCVYCGAEGLPLEVEHIIPRVRGGSNRVSNLTIACEACNRKKNTRTAAEFGYPHIQAKAKQPLQDAAAVNAIRWELWRRLSGWGLPVECGSGGRTKYNRIRQNLTQRALDRCGVRGWIRGKYRYSGCHHAPSDSSIWAWLPADVQNGPIWVSAYFRESLESSPWLSNRGNGDRGGQNGEEGWALHRTSGYSVKRILRYSLRHPKSNRNSMDVLSFRP